MAAKAIKKKTLYDRLGGKAGLTRIVGDFLDEFFKHSTITNPLVIKRHEAAFHPELKAQWIAFVTQATGGPKKYAGRTMRSSHAGMHITEKDFAATIAMMSSSLDRAEVAPRDKEQLLTLMRAQQKNIVGA